MHALSASDVASLRDTHRLSDIIDLRSTFELESEGRGPLADEPIAFHHTPLFDGDARSGDREAAERMSLGQRYLGLMEIAKEKIAGIVAILAESKGSAVYHCAAGKDRTGVLSAVLMGALGVSDEMIVADYALSAERIDEIIARVMSMKGYQDTLHDMPEDTLHAKPETMQEVVSGINEQYGSMGGYLRDAGLADGVVEALRANCLE